MGEFLLRLADGRECIATWRARNTLCHEGLDRLFHTMLPALVLPPTYVIGFLGCSLRAKELRPNPLLGAKPLDAKLTWADVTEASSEGGGYTAGMRASFGYSRQVVTFTAALEADGGAFESTEVQYENTHAWTPQEAAAWDDPSTATTIEQPPPEWVDARPWEPQVGYPWLRPRKLCADIGTPPDVSRAYFYPWDNTGALNWLCDFRKVGGYPVTGVFLGDHDHQQLIAVAQFRAAVLLRPGCTLYARYRGRLFA